MGQGGNVLRGGVKEEDGNDDVKRQVDGDESNQKTIYQLVNVKNGTGKLVEILKSSARMSSGSFALNKSMDFSGAHRELECQVDAQIRALVEPLLYNGGRGKWVSMARIWMSRFGRVVEESLEEPASLYDHEDSRFKNNDHYHWACWKLEERGAVGETALHICFLLSTPTHMILARKLLSMFPMLVNDIYLCDEYFGESSLHMAIVQENVRIVKLLLDYGASVHQRCLGSFFLPSDQKEKANAPVKKALERLRHRKRGKFGGDMLELDLQSNSLDFIDTNYDGYCYWGEFPLSFAVCLGLGDCYKLLLAKGANPNKQDSNGNSSLHMAVISNRIDMFDLCFSNGAELNLKNRQNLTPLSLAAKLKRVEMLFHILTIQRQVSWVFCRVGFVEVPLLGVDSINVNDGSRDDNSVLSIVAFGSSVEHLEMLNGLLARLLEIKWNTSIKHKFLCWFFMFLLFLLISFVAYISRIERPNEKQEVSTIKKYSECGVVCFVLYYLWIVIVRVIPNFRLKDISKALAEAPEMFMFTLTCLLILTCIPIRLLKLTGTEDFLVAIIVFTLPLKLLFFCRASRSVGSFVVMIYKIVVNDVLCFVVFLVIFVAGFSQSFLIIFKTHRGAQDGDGKNYFVNLFDGIISMHMMAYNEFSVVFDEFDSTDHPQLARILFCVYMILVSILLINMLIAMLGKTYQDIASQPNENLRQWARALLFVENLWSRGEKLSMLNKYSLLRPSSSTSADFNRFYCSTWPLTISDMLDINHLKSLRQENELNAARLSRCALRG